MASEACFRAEDVQYKQCDRCRARIRDKTRSSKTVTCECGREVLTTSLRDHLKTLFHEQYIAEKALLPANNKGEPDPVEQKAADLPMPSLVHRRFRVKQQPPTLQANPPKAVIDVPKPPIDTTKPTGSGARLPKPGSSLFPAAHLPNVVKERRAPSAHHHLAFRDK